MRQINDSDFKALDVFLEGLMLQIQQILLNADAYNRTQRINIVNQIKGILTSSTRPLLGVIEDMTGSIYYEATQSADKVLKNVRPNQNAFSVVDQDAIRALFYNLDDIKLEYTDQINDLMNQGALNLNHQLRRFSNEVQREIADELTRGIARGDATAKMAIKIRRLVESEGYTGIRAPSTRTRSGFINYSLKSEIRKIAQSSMIRASTSATFNRALEYGQDVVRASSHGDPSPMCNPHQGKKYSLSGKHPEYPPVASVMWDGKYKKGSGFHHPHCEHSFTISIDTAIQLQSL